MNITEMHPEKPAILRRRVLSKAGVDCSILALAPGEQTSCDNMPPARAHLLFVIEGGVSVQMGDLTFLVKAEDALHIAGGQEHRITAEEGGWAKLLRVDLPLPPPPSPPIYAFRGAEPELQTP